MDFNGNDARGESKLTITCSDDSIIEIVAHNMHILTMAKYWSKMASLKSMVIEPVMSVRRAHFLLYKQYGYTVQYATYDLNAFNFKVEWAYACRSVEVVRCSRVLEDSFAYRCAYQKCDNCEQNTLNWTEKGNYYFCLDCQLRLHQMQFDVQAMRKQI